MGKFDKLIKFLGLAPAEYADDAAKLLEKVDTPELATSLKGDVREEYLKILDEIYGDQATRAKNMGFGNKTWYHGSTVPIDEFKKEAMGLSTDAQSAKKGFFFTNDPSTAGDYANLANESGIIREGDNVTTRWLSDKETPQDIAEKELKNIKRDLMLSQDSPIQFDNYNKYVNGVNIKGTNYKSIPKLQESINYFRDKLQNADNPVDKDIFLKRIQALENGKVMLGSKKVQVEEMIKKAKILQDIIDSGGQNITDVRLKGNPLVKNYKGESYRDQTYSDLMVQAQNQNKDSVLFKNTYDPADPNNKVKQNIAAVFEPNQIRSTRAAFDPRFKNSPLLMAGAAAVPIDMNPIGDIKKGLGYYEQAKEAITKPLAQQLNIGKNPQDEKIFNSILKTGLDPVNYIPGAAGAGLGAIQMLTPSDEEIQQQALQRLIDENR